MLLCCILVATSTDKVYNLFCVLLLVVVPQTIFPLVSVGQGKVVVLLKLLTFNGLKKKKGSKLKV